MNDPVPGVVVEIRRIKNVKISTLHAKAERYRDGFVKLFREHEHAYVTNEDGSQMLDGAGRRISVTASWFAREMGIPKATFHNWLNPPPMRSDTEPTEPQMVDERGNVYTDGEFVGTTSPPRPGWSTWGLEAAGEIDGGATPRSERPQLSPIEKAAYNLFGKLASGRDLRAENQDALMGWAVVVRGAADHLIKLLQAEP